MGRLAAQDFAQFNGLLASAVERGVPLNAAVELLAAQARGGALRAALGSTASALREGVPLPEALARSPELFPPSYTALVDAGLRGNRLAQVLRQAETNDALRARVSRRMTELLAYLCLGAVIMTLVVGVLAFLGHNLSSEVRTALMVTDVPGFFEWVERFWWVVPSTFVVILVLGAVTFLGVFRARIFSRALFWVPVWGRLVKSRDLALFSTTMAVRLGAGATLPEALASAEASAGNRHSRRRVAAVRRRIEEGESLSSALFYESFFPRMLAWAVSMGEARGEVPDTFDTFARLYAAELDRNFGLVLQILTPLGLLALGNVALFTAMLVLSPFMAIIRIQQVLR
jgi:type II secretory pathway component PulF